MKTRNDRILNKIYKILPIIIIGLIPLLWFKKGCLIGGVDIDFPLFPIKQFFLRSYSWNPVLLGGTDYSTRFAGLFSFTLSQALLKSFNLSLIVVEKIYFVFWYTLTGLSMYFFIFQLVRGKDVKSYIVRYMAVFFYMVNFYQLHIWMIARKPELSGAILIPGLLGILIMMRKKRTNFIAISSLLFLLFLFTSGIGMNPPVVGIVFIFLFIYTIYYAGLINFYRNNNKSEARRNLLYLSLVLLMFVLVNLHWILSVGNYVLISTFTNTSRSLNVFNIMGLLEGTSRYNSFLNVLRLYGDNVWFDGFKNRLYLPFFANYLNNPFLILASFIFPILAFSAILISKKKHVIFFTLIAVITLFLSKGIHSPFGNVFLWMIKHIPGFWVYRAPWQKFTLITILSYSYLAAITCGFLYEKIPNVVKLYKVRIRHSKVIFLVLLITIHLVYHYGFIFGRMLPTTEERQVLPGFHQKYPDYLFKSAEWINSKKDQFKMVLLPDDKANAYYWGYGGAQDISADLFTKGLIFRQYGEGMVPPTSLDKVYNVFIASLYNELTPYAGKIAGLLNVRYLLHRNDFIYDWSGDNDSPEFVKNKLIKQKGITLEKSIGKWDFYKNKYELPHIYIPDNIIYVEGNLDTLPKLSYKEEFGPKTAVLFSSMVENRTEEEIINFENLSLPEEELVKIDVNKINPTKYIIEVSNVTKPFFVVFNEKYKSDWKVFKIKNEYRENLASLDFPKDLKLVFSDMKYLFKKPLVSSKNHYMINGWANGWYINVGDHKLNKKFTICLYYWPQSLFYIGFSISAISIIIWFAIGIKGILKRSKK